MTLAYIALALIVLASALAATLSRNLLQSAVALAVGSSALASMFYILGAPYAGSFELSVGAGLISIMFIIAISLCESIGGQQHGP
jgi:NADH-quinone oxidoreductase subunit J